MNVDDIGNVDKFENTEPMALIINFFFVLLLGLSYFYLVKDNFNTAKNLDTALVTSNTKRNQ
ncbi:MAG: hypothetical protein HeimC3_35430 [Candidatus Heimdallarchaeota archaeon LC_3]|nr:MAG: hypothetical protein HeimC3_51200 [Candidatus Heimdallarchaeota archaeon LC_3]OLS19132.1 MAG: hypothetical protein HeimC3_47080 [Candidatus Heimdallarchaeota archaeon LC_3]OLS21410.1 MAG: hypothetical protein HeimC3_35430 [Candidatus Heimdallarchaeota archaeon LC_3]